MGKKHVDIPPYGYRHEASDRFFMLTTDLFECVEFRKLGNAAQVFYLNLCAHMQTEEQRTCLYSVLKDYREILGKDWSDEELKVMVNGNKRTGTFPTMFVIPDKHLEQYGYSSSQASNLKKELIEAGFIRVKYGGKGRACGWTRNTTVYEFSFDWKYTKNGKYQKT